MTELIVHSIPQRLKALYTLIRILPVLSWSITSSLVGLGCAYTIDNKIRWLDFGLILLLVVLIHGVLSHALNDREDWLSGTDQLSPGILSGGSGVVTRKQYSLETLSFIWKAALVVVCITALYFIWSVGVSILILLGLAFWTTISYSCAPLRLSYHPLTGEWLCGFPAVFACTVGTCYVLTHKIPGIVLIAGAIHALLAIGLLMHHHLSDISSDLKSTPRKLTTVAWVAITLGVKKTFLVELVYFLLALLTGVAGALFFHPVFWITLPVALGCMGVALNTVPEDILSITTHEYLLYGLIISDAITKTALLFKWPG
jgi:1,4-dihydroxy-2-naphthoate octaprenyltransferase